MGAASAAREDRPIYAGDDRGFAPDVSGINALSYQVLLEPTQASWLFALDVAMPASHGTALTRDFRLVADEPVRTTTRYSAWAYPGAVIDPTLPTGCGTRDMVTGGRQSAHRRFCGRLGVAHGRSRSVPRERARVHTHGAFFLYVESAHAVESWTASTRFWFDSRRGFCSHFAGAFVYLRVLSAYQRE